LTKGLNINKEHLKINTKSFIQGFGLRPFIVRLAQQHPFDQSEDLLIEVLSYQINKAKTWTSAEFCIY